MTPRERLLQTINREVPDRPPVFATLTPQMAQKLSKEQFRFPMKNRLIPLLSTRISHTGLLTALGNDCVGIAAAAPKDSPTVTNDDGIIVNEWGMRFKDAGFI